jgi:hypothetical protein
MYLGEVVEIGPAEQLFTASAPLYPGAVKLDAVDGPAKPHLTSPLNGDPPSHITAFGLSLSPAARTPERCAPSETALGERRRGASAPA